MRKAAGLTPNTMTKLRRDEPIAMTVLYEICTNLSTDYGNILQYTTKDEDK